DVKKAIAEIRELRREMREFAKTTREDLRAHRLLNGNMDAYQWFLMISAHMQRHTLQIREVKGDPGYPGE
ncbi:MAG: DinB family protein, partial [Vicinamibacteraceae bacterium]